MWIKICGMTTSEAVEAALAARVDAIGFVFAESKRRVTPARAAELARPARGRVKCVAVTKHPTQRDIDEILSAFEPDILQTDLADLQMLQLRPATIVLPVVRGRVAAGTRAAAPDGATRSYTDVAHATTSLPARILFEGPVSGTGIPADWSLAQELARKAELILAGGLNPDNVATAIAEVQPFGVDVSSGVEHTPGIKSPDAITRFVRSARSALRAKETL